MRFKVNLKSMKLDVDKYVNTSLERYLTARLKKSGQLWLHATVLGIPIPTWSGASRETFQALARALGTSVPIGPTVSKVNRQALGRATGRGGLEVNVKTGKYFFFYESHLRYLEYNEYNRAIKGPPPAPFSNRVSLTPYRFQAKGEKAWKKFAQATRLPNPFKFLKGKKI